MLREAGVSLLGGHTVQDPEIKFGYAVTGAIDPDRVFTNSGARPGDVLFLTKPLGTGVIATALKFDRVDPAIADAAIQSMRTLNRTASEALQRLPKAAVHACTDITGFGLAGHGSEMAAGSGVTFTIAAGLVPIFAGARALASENRSGGMASNEEHFAAGVRIAEGVPVDLVSLLFDPQTSGGLMIAAAGEFAGQVNAALIAAGAPAWRIGSARSRLDRVLVDVEA
jgi:selenide,water dikinase